MNKKIYKAFHGISGIYTGSCFGISAIDIRYLESISSEPYSVSVFAALLKNMGLFMVPQLTLLLCLGSYFSIVAVRSKQSLFRHLPLLILLTIIMLTISVHIPINLQVFSGMVEPNQVGELVNRWKIWHWVRTVLAIALTISITKQTRQLT